MHRGSWQLIVGCWVVWLCYWAVMALFTKRTAERARGEAFRVPVIVVCVVWILVVPRTRSSLSDHLWTTSGALAVATVAMVAAGFCFSVWARATLGGNWSGDVTFKEGHELIERGPYALARHPIYTGMLCMGLGTAVDLAEPQGFILLAVACVAFTFKVRAEERLMTTHFPDAYPDYRRRVKAIIPHVI